MFYEIEGEVIDSARGANEAPGWKTARGDDRASMAPSDAKPVVSIVVPTRNEAGNVPVLVQRIEAAAGKRPVEVIFVDDSDDDTPAAVMTAGEESALPVRLIHRAPGQRHDGLGGAVLAGFAAARAPWVCVMDADLQHPPEVLPLLWSRASATGADLVVASRHADSGSVGDFSLIREAVSGFSTVAARVLFPRLLRQISDPMSGFFLVRRDAVDLSALQPRGFKILLEIVVRNPHLRIAEVGFRFGERYAGTSKANLKEGMRYFDHLAHLRFGEDWLRAIKFVLTGASGLLVNTLLLFLATTIGGLYYLVSAILATQGSSLWNFALTEFWVFGDRRTRAGRLGRFVAFLLMNNAAFAVRGPMLYVLTSVLGINYLISNVITLAVLLGVRYLLADRLIWGSGEKKQAPALAHSYDIHGVISVGSQVALPELEPFRARQPILEPTIQVRLGSVQRARQEKNSDGREHVTYDEGLGFLGFGIDVVLGDILRGEPIDVLANSILKYSPHVLYTNVVEPILRWTFVRKGYALVHGACLAYGEDAFLVTARTDTGKTTTMLRMLAEPRHAENPGAFISDDLTLVSPDGRVYTYPKPMTISHHTVKAINARTLTLPERLALIVQSRVHSRDGRRFAMWLTHHRLPVATINMMMQLVVPPPKYPVQRLIPSVKAARTARLAGLFIIQRGGVGTAQLDGCTALETLMKNCDDAYGFPPYHTIAGSLYCLGGADLREAEVTIVDSALAGRHAALVRSTTMDWSDRIQAIIHGEKHEEAWRPVMEGCSDLITIPALVPA
jgi:dolichol-phosphate mannosyltransferase